MNIKELHTTDKPVSTPSLFKSDASTGTAVAIKIDAGAQLSKHITKIPALLICISGHAIFDNEKGEKQDLKPGDFVKIEPEVMHWVDSVETSHLVLVR
jgi:quercetin dioxygenase-like cupin family protein|tara:strand:- start:5425 stop:5718 length:294 start_codon:yes stop_codon:yes gene_type:complete